MEQVKHVVLMAGAVVLVLLLFAALLLYLCTASLLGASSKPSLYASF